MKKSLNILTLTILVTTTAFAGTVTLQDAQSVAQNFYNSKTGKSQKAPATAALNYTRTESDGTVDFFVFDFSPAKGFVIVSANDNISPVIGYSTESNFSMGAPKSGLSEWMGHAAKHIYTAIQNNDLADQRISNQWSAYRQGKNASTAKCQQGVGPLLTTTWGQEQYYNQYCPYNSVDSQTCNTGCVATAMAQIMKYWNYPAQGTGTYAYNEKTPKFLWNYGIQSADFGSTVYNWSAMPAQLTDTNSALALLMYQCGVAVQMGYGDLNQGGSGAYSLKSEVPNWKPTSESAYVKYFSYNPNSIKGVVEANYTSAAWVSLLQTELNQGRPVQYVGYDTLFGGNAWVLDGYDNNGMFHMNWGWDGLDNGYFSLSSLSVNGFNFNSDEAALIGIQPNVSFPVQAEPSKTTACAGENIMLISRGPATSTYSWMPNDGLSCPTCASTYASPSVTTTYTVTVDSAGFRNSVSFTVYVKALPVLDTVMVNNVTDHGGHDGSISVIVSPLSAQSLTFSWSTGESSSFISNLSTGTYSLTVSDTTGCSLSFSRAISEPLFFVPSTHLIAVPYTNVYGGLGQNVSVSKENYSDNFGGDEKSNISAVNTVENEGVMSVYPSPATSEIFVKTANTNPATVTLLNSAGQTLVKQPSNGLQSQIDLTSFAAGVYFVQVEQGGKTTVKEFIKK